MQPLTRLALLGAGLSALRARYDEREAGRTVCLAWHRLAPRERWEALPRSERRYTVPVDRFEGQLAALAGAGYSVVSLDAVLDHATGRRPLPPRTVCLTFDDGCESVYRYALPILVRRGLTATLFMTVAEDAAVFGPQTPHGERRMTRDELAAWSRALDVGAHGVTHRGLASLAPAAALEELRASRRTLEAWLGRPVRAASMPLDLWTPETQELCRQAGYEAVCVSKPGAVRVGSDPLRLRRLVVDGRLDGPSLLRSLAPWAMVRARGVKALKGLPPRMLGEAAWMPLRRLLLDGWTPGADNRRRRP